MNDFFEGEVRTVASNLDIEDIFKGRDEFKSCILKALNGPLNDIGLLILNGNIQDLQDSENSKYFFNLSKRIASQAENRAKVDIAEQNKIGTLGENERSKEIAISNATLKKLQEEQKFIENQAKIENKAKELILDEQKQTDVEKKLEQRLKHRELLI